VSVIPLFVFAGLYLAGIAGLAFVAGCEAILAPYGEAVRPEIQERRSQFPGWLRQPRRGQVLFLSARVFFVSLSAAMALLLCRIPADWWGWLLGLILFPAIPVFGELLPRARFRRPTREQIEKASRFFDRFQGYFLAPLARPVVFVADRMVHFFGGDSLDGDSNGGGNSNHADEVTLPGTDGLVLQEQKMIQAIAEMGETSVRELMVPRTAMECLDVRSGLSEVLDKITTCMHSRIPVYEEDVDHVIGVLHVKDLFELWEGREVTAGPPDAVNGEFDLRPFLRPAQFVPETKKIRELFSEFQEEKIHLAIVVDEYGGTAGLVTLEDLLEEIVGEIQDEFDEEPVPYEERSDGAYVVDGTTHTDDLKEDLGIELPESEDYDTVSGFILSRLGEVPPVGEVIEHPGVRLTVESADERRIERVKVERVVEPTEKQD
jgi:CBS domain containing-hemolysin-like protein